MPRPRQLWTNRRRRANPSGGVQIYEFAKDGKLVTKDFPSKAEADAYLAASVAEKERAGYRTRTETVAPLELQAIYNQHQKALQAGQGSPHPLADLRGRNLKGWDFSKVDWSKADFRGADLRNVNFESATLEEADFRGADLRGAKFLLAKVGLAEFGDALLDPAALDNAKDVEEAFGVPEPIRDRVRAKKRKRATYAPAPSFRPSRNKPRGGYAIRQDRFSPFHDTAYDTIKKTKEAADLFFEQGSIYQVLDDGGRLRQYFAGTPAVDTANPRVAVKTNDGSGVFAFFREPDEALGWADENLPAGVKFDLYKINRGLVDVKLGEYFRAPDEEVGGSSVTLSLIKGRKQGTKKNVYLIEATEDLTETVVYRSDNFSTKAEAKKALTVAKKKLKKMGYKNINVLMPNPTMAKIEELGVDAIPYEVVEAAFAARDWYDGMGDPLYRLQSASWADLGPSDYDDAADSYRYILSRHGEEIEDAWQLEEYATALEMFAEALRRDGVKDT